MKHGRQFKKKKEKSEIFQSVAQRKETEKENSLETSK